MRSKIILKIVIILTCLATAKYASAQFEGWNFEIIPNPVEDILNHASAVDESGMIWMGTRLGIMTFDGISYKLNPIFQEVEIRSKTLHVRNLKFDPMGRLWVLTDDRGLLVYDFRTGEHHLLNSSSKADIELSDQRCGDVVFEDSIAWLVTFDHQIHKVNLDILSVATYDTWDNVLAAFPNAKHVSTGSIVKRDNFLWIGSEYGITKFNTISTESQLITYDFKVELETSSILKYAMYLNGEDLMISLPFKNHSGICVLDINSNKWKFCSDLSSDREQNSDHFFLSLHIGAFSKWSDSILIAGARRLGFHAIDPKTYKSKFFSEDDLNLEFRDLQEIYQVVKVSENIGYKV